MSSTPTPATPRPIHVKVLSRWQSSGQITLLNSDTMTSNVPVPIKAIPKGGLETAKINLHIYIQNYAKSVDFIS